MQVGQQVERLEQVVYMFQWQHFATLCLQTGWRISTQFIDNVRRRTRRRPLHS